jgi:hypothetical protein
VSAGRADQVLDSGAPGRRRWTWVVSVAAGLVGVFIGAAGMHAIDRKPMAISQGATSKIDIDVSLGLNAGGLVGAPGQPVVILPLVFVNAASQEVTLTSLRVEGPGAALVPDPSGEPVPTLPLRLPPGQFVDYRVGLSSDCSVIVRPLPQLILVVASPGHETQTVPVQVPDLATIWGQTLLPPACNT